MSSLFKDVAEDGTVTYSDVNRVQLINKESPDIPFRNGFGTRLIDKMYPITLPYFPADKKFKIIVEEFLTDKNNGDYDTIGYLQLILPDGKVVERPLPWKNRSILHSLIFASRKNGELT